MFASNAEEKFDLILENFAEYEQTLLELAFQHSLYHGTIEELLDGSLILINRRLSNLLSSARLYIDQIAHELSEIYGKKSEEASKFEIATNTAYDTSPGYCVMETLRNFSQHRGLPIHQVSFSADADDAGGVRKVRCSVKPSTKIETLKTDSKVKPAAIEQLELSQDKNGFAEITSFVRQYVEALANVHGVLRKTIADELKECDGLVESLIAKASTAFEGNVIGLAAVAWNDQGTMAEKEYLNERAVNRRRALEKKHQFLDSISNRYVSSN